MLVRCDTRRTAQRYAGEKRHARAQHRAWVSHAQRGRAATARWPPKAHEKKSQAHERPSDGTSKKSWIPSAIRSLSGRDLQLIMLHSWALRPFILHDDDCPYQTITTTTYCTFFFPRHVFVLGTRANQYKPSAAATLNTIYAHMMPKSRQRSP